MNNLQTKLTVCLDVPPKTNSNGQQMIGLMLDGVELVEMPISDFVHTDDYSVLSPESKLSINSWM